MRLIYINNILSILVTLTFTSNAVADGAYSPNKNTKTNISIPVTELKWASTEIVAPNGKGPLQVAPAFGDFTSGAHGTFVKMPAGFVGAEHTHSSDFYVAVITGVAANTSIGDKDTLLPAGSYWFQPGGKAHVTKCLSTTECIFFVNQAAKFDYLISDQH